MTRDTTAHDDGDHSLCDPYKDCVDAWCSQVVYQDRLSMELCENTVEPYSRYCADHNGE